MMAEEKRVLACPFSVQLNHLKECDIVGAILVELQALLMLAWHVSQHKEQSQRQRNAGPSTKSSERRRSDKM